METEGQVNLEDVGLEPGGGPAEADKVAANRGLEEVCVGAKG